MNIEQQTFIAKGIPLTESRFVEIMEKICQEEIAKITDTSGIWTYERGKKETWEQMLGYIRSYKEGTYL